MNLVNIMRYCKNIYPNSYSHFSYRLERVDDPEEKALILRKNSCFTEISNILYIHEWSVRANRSRIRRKMKLDKKVNLKAHLLVLMGEENSMSENNFHLQDDSYLKY